LLNLEYLYLYNNDFTGTLPTEICNLCASNQLAVYASNTNIEFGADCNC